MWKMATTLNSLLTSENERLQQLTEDLDQKHSHMTSEVQIHCLLTSFSPSHFHQLYVCVILEVSIVYLFLVPLSESCCQQSRSASERAAGSD